MSHAGIDLTNSDLPDKQSIFASSTCDYVIWLVDMHTTCVNDKFL